MLNKSEECAVAEVERRLVSKFADIPAAQVTAAVAQARTRFAGSKIRDFVPLLVERRASDELTSSAS